MTGGFTREAGLNTDDKEMAYIITAVGAGGKTSYLKKRALEYLRQGKRAAITTTTHIWPPDPGRLLSGEIPMPDAVVCANDFMAVGLANRLIDGMSQTRRLLCGLAILSPP